MSNNSPLDELAAEADTALELCWQRLAADHILDEDHIRKLVRAWRLKREVFTKRETERQRRREYDESPRFGPDDVDEATEWLKANDAFGRMRSPANIIKKANDMWYDENVKGVGNEST